MAGKTPLVLAVGDHVRLKTRDTNQHTAYGAEAADPTMFHDAVDGIVFSIRNVKTGALVTKTTGKLTDHVFELVYIRTFSPRYASLRNAPRGADDPTMTAGWKRLRATLRKAAEEGKIFSTASNELLEGSPLAGMLDGWKVVKIWSEQIDSLEKAETEPAA